MTAIEQLKTLKKEIKLPYIPLWELSNRLAFGFSKIDSFNSFDEFADQLGKNGWKANINGWCWGEICASYKHLISTAMGFSQWKDERKWEKIEDLKLEDLTPEQQKYLKKIDVLSIGFSDDGTAYVFTNKEEEPKIRKWLAPIFKELDLLSG